MRIPGLGKDGDGEAKAKRKHKGWRGLAKDAWGPGEAMPGSLTRNVLNELRGEGPARHEERVPYEVLKDRYRRFSNANKCLLLLAGVSLSGFVATGLDALGAGSLWNPVIFAAAGGLFAVSYLRGAFRLWAVRQVVLDGGGELGRIIVFADFARAVRGNWEEALPLALPPPKRTLE